MPSKGCESRRSEQIAYLCWSGVIDLHLDLDATSLVLLEAGPFERTDGSGELFLTVGAGQRRGDDFETDKGAVTSHVQVNGWGWADCPTDASGVAEELADRGAYFGAGFRSEDETLNSDAEASVGWRGE
jgi:hypothetical protein